MRKRCCYRRIFKTQQAADLIWKDETLDQFKEDIESGTFLLSKKDLMIAILRVNASLRDKDISLIGNKVRMFGII